MTIGIVAGIWRYPVKSMRGEQIPRATLTVRGLPGDRAYAVVDRTTGKVASAKHPRVWGRLLTCRAAVVDPFCASAPTVHITMPDSRTVTAGSGHANIALAALLDRDVELSAIPPATAEIERYWPDVDGLPLRDTITSGAIGAGAPPGTFFDFAPLHVLTTASLDRLGSLYVGGRVEVRRFRPNLLVTPLGSGDGFIENAWVGQTLQIGEEARIHITDPTPRCVIPTLAQADLSQDVGVLRAVAAHNRPSIPALGGEALPSLGVYAVVERAGTIRRGDMVRLM
jgi:uncharacterized protein YcbX